MRIDLEIGSKVLFVRRATRTAGVGHVEAISVTAEGTTVTVLTGGGEHWIVALEDVCEEPWRYSSLTGQWLRDKLEPPEPEEEAPASIPIETTQAHGVEIPVRSVEAPDVPAVEA